MDVEHTDLGARIALWEKIVSLKFILKDEYLPESSFEDSFLLDNGKEISRVYVELNEVSIHNKNTWQESMLFLSKHMKLLEEFFKEYKDMLSV